jgi:hypothetical protein
VTVRLDHAIVPARNHRASAELLATLLGVPWSKAGVGSFCPVYVNDGLTLDFDQADGPIAAQHFCFRVSEAEFDRILGKIKARGIAYRSAPHGRVDMRVGAHKGGRIVYWNEPDGHVWEALTVSYARQPTRRKQKGAGRARVSRRPGSARSGR